MKPKVKYVLFDVAGTLLYKPKVYTTLFDIVNAHGFKGTINELKLKHKIVSELIHFPDRTNKEFYRYFNESLLFAVGIVPNEEIISEIFSRCSYLPWEKFTDTDILTQINLPVGVISNFNNSLKEKLNNFFGPVFKEILVSEEMGTGKPDIEFYKTAINKTGVSPGEILYIGDSLKLDIQPALSAGMFPLLVDRDNFFPYSGYSINNLKQIIKYL